jgi:hypothetical protein
MPQEALTRGIGILVLLSKEGCNNSVWRSTQLAIYPLDLNKKHFGVGSNPRPEEDLRELTICIKGYRSHSFIYSYILGSSCLPQDALVCRQGGLR